MTTNELIFLVEEDPEGGYNAKAPGQSIFVQGDNFETLKVNIKDALECHFDTREDQDRYSYSFNFANITHCP